MEYAAAAAAAKSLQLCLTLRDPMDCSPPGSSVHGTLQARILEWVAISSFPPPGVGLSTPGIGPPSPPSASGFFYYLSHVLTCKKISTVELWTLNLESLAIWECRQSNSLLLLLLSRFSCVWLFATPWTAAYQAPPSMGFSRQQYWSVVPLPYPILTSLILG